LSITKFIADASGGIIVLAPPELTTEQAMEHARQSRLWPRHAAKLMMREVLDDGRIRYTVT
jgi:hypothetical protein